MKKANLDFKKAVYYYSMGSSQRFGATDPYWTLAVHTYPPVGEHQLGKHLDFQSSLVPHKCQGIIIKKSLSVPSILKQVRGRKLSHLEGVKEDIMGM